MASTAPAALRKDATIALNQEIARALESYESLLRSLTLSGAAEALPAPEIAAAKLARTLEALLRMVVDAQLTRLARKEEDGAEAAAA